MGFVYLIGALIVIIVFFYVYWSSREKMYERIAYESKCYGTDNESIQNEISGHGLEIFRKRDGQVKIGIVGKVEDGKIYLADLTLHAIVSEAAANSFSSSGRYRRRVTGNQSMFNGLTTACFVVSKRLTLPNAFLCPETLYEKGAALLGGQDIDFDNDDVFSDRFTLQGPSEVNIRDYFKKKLRNELCRILPGGVSLEFSEDAFVLYTSLPASYSTATTLLKVGRELYDFLKQYEPIYENDWNMSKKTKLIIAIPAFFLILVLYTVYCYKQEESYFNNELNISFRIGGFISNKDYIQFGNNSKIIDDLVNRWENDLNKLKYRSNRGDESDENLLGYSFLHFKRINWEYDKYGNHLKKIEIKPDYDFDFENFSDKEKLLIDEGIQDLNRELTIEIIKKIPYCVYGDNETDKKCVGSLSEKLSTMLRYYLVWFKEHNPNKSCAYIFSLGIKLATAFKNGCYSEFGRKNACLNSACLCLSLMDLIRENKLNKGEKIQCLKVLDDIERIERDIGVFEKELYEAHLSRYEKISRKYSFYSAIVEHFYGSGIEHIKNKYAEYKQGKRYSSDQLEQYPFAFSYFYNDLEINMSFLKEEKAARSVLKAYLQDELGKQVTSIDPYDQKPIKVLNKDGKRYYFCASSLEVPNIQYGKSPKAQVGVREDINGKPYEKTNYDFFLAGDMRDFNSYSRKSYTHNHWDAVL